MIMCSCEGSMQLFEAEMRCALIEAETREEVMREMEERMRIMEEKYSRRLMSEVCPIVTSGLTSEPIRYSQAGAE